MNHCIIKRDLHGNYRISFFSDFRSVKNDIVSSSRNYDYESFARSKRTVIDYGMNNDFDFFVTITFDGKKVDRYNSHSVLRKLQNALKDYRRFYDCDFAYVLVPERHADGAIHCHGLFKIGRTDLVERHFDVKRRCVYYRIEFFYRRLGRFRMDKIATNATYVSAYITKYMTKENERIFQRRYICSKGLHSGDVVVNVSGDDAIPFLDIMLAHCVFCTGEILDIKPVVNRDFCRIYSLDETTFRMLFYNVNPNP